MPGIASATGLIEARIHPIYRPKLKCIELSGLVKPAPLSLRPFSGLFNPYPYGCSVLCNHPADCEAKEVLRRAKDSWASEGKALLLPEEMEMIKANLVSTTDGSGNMGTAEVDTAAIPEELFRKYTETDSRPLTPAPTLASGPVLSNRPNQEELPITSNPRERTTLVLDLRANAQKLLDNDTFSWHALTLELPPTPRKSQIFVSKPVVKHQAPSVSIPPQFSSIEAFELSSSGNIEENETLEQSKDVTVVRRRGKCLRKRKCRRSSAYGQQTEVRDLFEPTDTQVSHIGDSRRTSVHTTNGDAENPTSSPKKVPVSSNTFSTMTSSFLQPEILKHLCRELDRDKVEKEFSIRRKLAFEEALRVKGENHTRPKGSQTFSIPVVRNAPRLFSRQSARFEILDSESLRGLRVLDYLSKHVSVSSGSKQFFGRIFNKFQEEAIGSVRYILPKDVNEALEEVVGKPITEEQEGYLRTLVGEIKEPLNFRSWCGLCAAVERLICPLSSKEIDPPTWLERTDFEALERRLKSVQVDPKIVRFLQEICEK